jgi:hypothetical protein
MGGGPEALWAPLSSKLNSFSSLMYLHSVLVLYRWCHDATHTPQVLMETLDTDLQCSQDTLNLQ